MRPPPASLPALRDCHHRQVVVTNDCHCGQVVVTKCVVIGDLL